MSDTLTRFLERSPCPFAQRAGIFPCAPWHDTRPTGAKLTKLAREIESFVRDDSFDLAVLEIHSASSITSPQEGGMFIHALLAGLHERDRRAEGPLDSGVTDPSWDFEFGRQAFFVSLFAPFYPDGHSRWSGAQDSAFVLLQPERGFRRFGISSRLPGRRRLSERVHSRFKTHGVEYDLRLNTDAPKALRYVKPIHQGDPPIRWWELPVEPAACG